ncbi:MAG: hypothetical protein JSR18_06405 [Proteobacteria bacterium]|nr:hypothetical protein [Pseudomonadota bacterium]
MTAPHVFAIDELFTFVLAILAILTGIALNRRFAWLARSNIPPAVSGGLLFAAASALLFRFGGIELAFGTTIRGALLLIFFAGLGLGAKFSGLRRGGFGVALMCAAIAVAIIAQNLAGVVLARLFGLAPALGPFVGSAAFMGGHGTAAAWSQTAQGSALPGAFEIGIGAATLGLIAGGIVAGPLGSALARHAARRAADAGTPVPATDTLHATGKDTGLVDILSSDRWLRTLLVISGALGLGQLFEWCAAGTSFTMPPFLAAMFGGIVLTNLADVVRRPLDSHVTDLIGTIALRLFLAMSMLSLKVWVLADYAGLMAAAVVVQVAIIAALACVLFVLLRRDHDAAVAAAGFVGFGIGAMPVGLGTMRRLVDVTGPAPRAFLIVTLAGSLFLDAANAVVIDAFFDHF